MGTVVGMGRPRGFDEARAVAAAAELFARRSYDGTSVDDLVNETGVHRGSLYKTFGSKRGLYLSALRHHVDEDVTRCADTLAAAGAGPHEVLQSRPDLRFLLLAAAERAEADEEVAAEVARGLALLDAALSGALPEDAASSEDAAGGEAAGRTAMVLGLLLRDRVNAGAART